MSSYEVQIADDILNYRIPKVRDDIHFWMVRTQGGSFYKEFLRENYVAYGFNLIDKSTDLKSEILKDEIEMRYDKKQGQRAINQCNYFMNTIQPNDILIIPNKHLEEVVIAVAEEYYEVAECTIQEEVEVLWKLKNEKALLQEVRCPYKKRWRIKVLKQVKGDKLNHHLYKTLRNYSGIDDIDEHAIYILSLILDNFFYNNNLHIILSVNTADDIELANLSGILYGSSKYFSHFVRRDQITAKVNVCSQGDIFIVIKDIFEYIHDHGPTFVATFLGLFCGTYGIMKLKEVPTFLQEIFSLKEHYKQEKISTKMKEEELRGKQLENNMKELEIQQKQREINQALENQSSNGLPTAEEQNMIMEASEFLDITIDRFEADNEEAISTILEVGE